MSSLPEALLDPAAYPHAVDGVELIETHLSWVFLTGEFVYKVKKPLRFDFVDFSTLERRHFFCEEEVRCNRSFAPELYLGVVPIERQSDGRLVVGAPSAAEEQMGKDSVVEEYAVHMVAFESAMQADRLLEQGELTQEEMSLFGGRLAAQHKLLPELERTYNPHEAILENFGTLRQTQCGERFVSELTALENQAEAQLDTYGAYLQTRRAQHFVRECHGDLHLSNLARLPDGLTAFDCLEFDEDLRNIDVWCDSGFLFMDCCVRGRADLAYAFVDGYLNVSGDYAGVQLLPMFAAYRSVVRAKIAALRYEQVQQASVLARAHQHLSWPLQRFERGVGRLWVTCGLSGSGKSYWAQRLLPILPAIRLRSDVLRKSQHGLSPLAQSHSDVGAGLYQAQSSDQVYQSLGEYAVNLLQQGEQVIVDAACLQRAQREILYAAAAGVGAVVTLLFFTAPEEVLSQRILDRAQRAEDPSEADTAVLAWQIDHIETPGEDEPVVVLDTQTLSVSSLVTQLSI